MIHRWLLGALGLITTTGLAGGGTQVVPSVEFTQDGRSLSCWAELLGGSGLVDDMAEPADFFPFDTTVRASTSGGFSESEGLAFGSASQSSTISTFAAEGRGEAFASVSSTPKEPGCGVFTYANGYSSFFVNFTIAEPTALTVSARVEAQTTGCCQGSAYTVFEINKADPFQQVFRVEAQASAGESADQEDSQTIMLQPGDYFIQAVADISMPEICGTEESGTGSWEFVVNFGDRDRDGLLDIWEVEGIDVNNDGTIDLDLPALGANPDRKDLFVEIDAMTGREPMAQALADVVAAFDNAPVAPAGPGQLAGISLHAIVDETGLPLVDWPNSFADFDTFKSAHFGTPTERASGNWDNIRTAREWAFRYCAFANTYNGGSSSGLAEYPGNDFIVSLGGWSTPGGTKDQQAGTFMHELGHCLGLGHGGIDSVNYKPNYYSVMNYHWQTPQSGYPELWRLDYSRERLADLNEATLLEPDGLGAFEPLYATVFVPFTANSQWAWAGLADGNAADWDDDGMIDATPVAVDTNLACPLCSGCTCSGTPGELLRGNDDWDTLWYHLTGPVNFADGHEVTTIDEEFDLADFNANELIPAPPVAACPGDADGDGLVNFVDLNIVLDSWGMPGPEGDVDASGFVDFADLNLVLDSWGGGCR